MNFRAVSKYFIAVLLLLIIHACGGSDGQKAPLTSTDLTLPTADFDSDGLINSEDTDDDDDGVADDQDCAPFDANIFSGAIDLPDSKYIDTNCDLVDGDLAKAVWVSETEGLDSNDGSIAEPVKTITTAIALANTDPAHPKDVYVVAGDYSEDVELINGINLFGGFSILNADNLRMRNIKTNVTEIKGKDGDKKVTFAMHHGGGSQDQTIDYTLLVNSSDSTVDGFTINGDSAGETVFVLDSNTSITNNIILESKPSVPRDISIAVGIVPSNATKKDFVVNINDNKIKMMGNGDQTNGRMSFGIIALPGYLFDGTLKLNVERNEITAEGDSELASAIYISDDKEDLNSNPDGDNNADFSLSAKNNDISIDGNFAFALGLWSSYFLPTGLLGGLDNSLAYLDSLEWSGNKVMISSDTWMATGINFGFVRNSALISNSIFSLTGANDYSFGIMSISTETDTYYNTIYVKNSKSYGSGILLVPNDGLIVGYPNVKARNIYNNIIAVQNTSAGTCLTGGIAEFPEVADNNHVLMSNPAEVKNNNITVSSDCSMTGLYLDLKEVNPNVIFNEVQTADDLNSKKDFLPADPTIFEGNISADPLFTDVANGDFTLPETSPCIDTGFNFEADWTDIIGTLRPQRSGVDIGAYELQISE